MHARQNRKITQRSSKNLLYSTLLRLHYTITVNGRKNTHHTTVNNTKSTVQTHTHTHTLHTVTARQRTQIETVNMY